MWLIFDVDASQACNKTPAGATLYVGSGTFDTVSGCGLYFSVVGAGQSLTTLNMSRHAVLAAQPTPSGFSYNVAVSNITLWASSALLPGYPMLFSYGNTVRVTNVLFNSTSTMAVLAEGSTLFYMQNVIVTGTADPSLNVLPMQLDYSTVAHLTNCTFHDLYGFGSSTVFIDTGSSVVIDNSAFFNIISPQLGGAIFSTSSNLAVINSSFTNLAVATSTYPQAGGGAIFVQALAAESQVNITGCTFSNLWVDPTNARGGAIWVYDMSMANILNNTFINSTAMHGGAIYMAGNVRSTVSISYNVAIGCSANTGGTFYVALLGGGTLQFVGNNVTATTILNFPYGPAVDLGSSSATFTAVVSGNSITNTVSATLSPAEFSFRNYSTALSTELSVLGMTTTLAGNNLQGLYPGVPSLSIWNSTMTITTDASGNAPVIKGFNILSASNVTLATDLNLVNGGSIITQLDVTDTPISQALANIYLNGHTLTVNNATATYFQNIRFFNGTIVFSGGRARFCCDLLGPGIPPSLIVAYGIAFSNTTLLVTNGQYLRWASSLVPVTFSGSASSMIVNGSAIFDAKAYASSTLAVPMLTVDSGASFQASAFKVVGNVQVTNSAALVLYPARVASPLSVVGSLVVASASVQLVPTEALFPFSPIVTLHDPYSNVLSYSGSLTNNSGSITSPSTILYQSQWAGSTLAAAPIRVQPTVTIGNDLSSLIVQLVIPTPLVVGSDCAGFIDFANNPALDFTTLVCLQQSSTSIVITSSALPTPSQQLVIDPSNQYAHTAPSNIQAPLSPVVPSAVIQPASTSFTCGSIILDGSHSSGLGSYPGSFYWSLASSTSSTTAGLVSYLSGLPASTSVLEIPTSYLTADATYVFALTVQNMFGQTSSPGYVSITPTNLVFLPPLALDGPAQRQMFSGTDLVVTGLVDYTGCEWESNRVTFQWFQVSNTQVETALNAPSSATPSLHLSAAWFGTTSFSTSYTFRLRAYPASFLGSTASSNVTVEVRYGTRPLAAVSTSRSNFYNEAISLSMKAVSYNGETPTIAWSVVSCPLTYNTSFFSPSFAAVHNGSALPSAVTYDCIDPSSGTPFVFPFSTRSGSTTSILQGAIAPGNYVLLASVSTSSDCTSVTVPFTLYGSATASPPIVTISLPSVNPSLATNKLVLSAEVSDPSGSFSSGYSYLWSVSFGSLDISSLINGMPYLAIPFNSLTPNQNVFVTVSVASLATPSLIGNATIQLPVAQVPTGGFLVVSPNSGVSGSTVFNLSAESWSTPFWPLSYLFSYVQADGTEVSISEVTGTSSLNQVVLQVPLNNETSEIQVMVRVIDSLGGVAVSNATIQLLPPSGSTPGTVALLSPLTAAFNASSWRNMNNVLNAAALSDAQSLSSSELDVLWASVASLASSTIVPTQENAAVLLTQLAHHLGCIQVTSGAQVDALAFLLDALVSANTSAFGTSSYFADKASQHFIASMAALLTYRQTTNDTMVADPVAAVRNHGVSVLTSLLPGERNYSTQSSLGLGVASGYYNVNTSGATGQLQGTENSPIFSFNTSDVSSTTIGGYIGFSYSFYNGTFPFLAGNNSIGQVLDVQLYSNASTRSTLTLTSVGAVFNTSGTQIPPTAACSTYDSSTGTWSSTGCSTSIRTGSASCSCNTLAPLSIVFSITSAPESTPSPTSSIRNPGGGPLSTTSIVAIVVVGTVIISLAIFAPIYWVKNPTFRKKLYMRVLQKSVPEANPMQ